MLVNLQNLPGLASLKAQAAGGNAFDFGDFGNLDGVGGTTLTPDPTFSLEKVDPELSTATNASNGSSFEHLLEQAIGAVNKQDDKAAKIALDYATGGSVDTHQVMIEMAKAEAMLHITSQTVNKTASGLQTLFNLQI